MSERKIKLWSIPLMVLLEKKSCNAEEHVLVQEVVEE